MESVNRYYNNLNILIGVNNDHRNFSSHNRNYTGNCLYTG